MFDPSPIHHSSGADRFHCSLCVYFHWLHSSCIYPVRPLLHSKRSHDLEFIFIGTLFSWHLKFLLGPTYCLTSTVYPNIAADQVILHLCQMKTSHRERKKKQHPRHMTRTFWSFKPVDTDCGFSRWHGPGSLWKVHQHLVQSGPEGRADHTLIPAISTTTYGQYMNPTLTRYPLILIALHMFFLAIFSSCRDKKAFFKFSQLPPPTGFVSSSLSTSLLSQRGSPCNC